MKTSRREFLAASGAALAVMPGPLCAAQTRFAPTGVIDCQSHLFSSDMLALMEKRRSDPVVFTKDGTPPYIIGRLDHQVTVLQRGPKNLTRTPSEYLKSVWLDIVSPLPLAMKFALEFMGADRLLYASDHPWVEPRLILEGLRSLNLSPGDERKIASGNARQLFKPAP